MAGCGRGSRGGRGRGRRQWSTDDGWEEWGGYMSAKKQKLEEQYSTSAVISNIFANISVYVNGYTDPSCHEIKRLVTSNGGTYHHYYSRTKVTHIIASNLPTSKINQIRDEKIVKPKWIVDSVNAGKLIPYQRYQLYKAETSHQNVFFINSKNTTANDISVITETEQSDKSCFNNDSVETRLNFANGFSEHSKTLLNVSESTCPCADNVPLVANLSSSVVANVERPAVLNCSDDLLFDVETPPEEEKRFDIENVNDGTDNSALADLDRRSNNPGSAPEKLVDDTTTDNRKLVTEFFSHSRLHYISTWCAESKAYVASLQNQEKLCLSGRDKLRQLCSALKNDDVVQQTTKFRKHVMHVDMDCFFVSVGLLSRPDLRGKPVAVTHTRGGGPTFQNHTSSVKQEEALWQDKGTSLNDFGCNLDHPNMTKPEAVNAKDFYNSMADIASCSYEARQAGVKNGMFFGRAKQLCPDLIPIPYDFDGYQRVSRLLYDTVSSYTHDIEAVSCDEMFVDCADLINNTGASCLDFASLLREDILERTGCTASVGIGANMLQAKIATREAKPNGQFWLTPENVNNFLKDKKVGDLPGVGYSLKAKLDSLGISTCGDLQRQPLQFLQKNFGVKTGQSLYDHCRGIDDRSFQSEAARKSVSAEMNYGIRFTTAPEVENFLGELAFEVHSRMTKIQRKCKAITLKLKVRQPDAPIQTAKFMGHGKCDNISKSSKLASATNSVDVITAECINLLRKITPTPSDLRGVGIQLSSLEPLQLGSQSTSATATSAGCRSILDFTTNVPARDLTINAPAISDCATDSLVMNVTALPPNSTKRLPPLPMLPSFETDFAAAISESTRDFFNRPNSDCSWYLPSSSQIDMEVLQSLPSEIRSSIERALSLNENSESTGRRPENGEQNGPDESGRPSCSFWSNVQPPNRFEPALPSFSQLDADVMDALPDDIRREIRAAYQTDENPGSAEALPTVHPLMRPEIVNSPTKRQLSPKKDYSSKPTTSKNSPKKNPSSPFKAPVGQPPRRRKYKARKKAPFAVMQKQFTDPCLGRANAVMSTTAITAIDQFEQPSPVVVVPATNVEFTAGSESVEDIKSMLREWFNNCDDPSKEDLEAFVTYLVQLVHSCNLERVCVVLKFLQRLMLRESAQISWRDGMAWIIDQTQAVIRSVYGGSLHLNYRY